MFLYNVHTPSKTFALTHQDSDDHAKLLERIIKKGGLSREEAGGVREGKDGAGIVYEFEGGRWSLEDDDDKKIMHDRLPPATTPSVTLHVTLPTHHAHFAAPPTFPSALKTSKSKKSKSGDSTNGSDAGAPPKKASPPSLGAPAPTGDKKPNGTGNGSRSVSGASKASQKSSSGPKQSSATDGPVPGEKISVIKHYDAQSVRSTRSRKSKYGNDDVEPMGEAHKRAWHEFHNGAGVRTVTGKVGDVENVRMLLKPGYRNVYVSRSFAIKNKLVDPKYTMGLSGYTGLKTLGAVHITVGSQTKSHPAFINEEMHFDVVLGRTWVEKMNIKIDPLDQTKLTYMNTGEQIACDIVVLKDAQGNKIFIT